MIIRPRPSAFELPFIWRGSIVPRISARLAVVLLLGGAVALIHWRHPTALPQIELAPFSLAGLGLSLFLGFRNSAAYDRWWEGRKLWGQIIADSRGLMREADALIGDRREIECVGDRLNDFARALRSQLRGAELEYESSPNAVLIDQTTALADLMQKRLLTEIGYRILSERLMSLQLAQAGCERLRATPLPFAYSLLLHRTAWMFCLLLPFGLVGALGLATPLATVVLAYTVFGLDALGDELEEPFGASANALPLDALVRSVEIAVAEVLGYVIPPPLLPQKFLLT